MTHFTNQDRKNWMGLLARAATSHLQSCLENIGELPVAAEIRPPEIGMVMVRGRVTGSGSPFNLGEMTVTRCSVSVAGVTGHALVRGRRTDHARLAAVADALLQDETWFGVLSPHLIAPLREAEALLSARRSEDAAATKVDFFTMARGEDER